MPEPFHEKSIHNGLIPWIHYVPLRRDLKDLSEKLAWCEENDSQARDIALEGQRHASVYSDRSFELAVAQRILIRFAANIHRRD